MTLINLDTSNVRQIRIILISVSLVFMAVAAYFVYEQFCYRGNQIRKAQELFGEYRSAKALAILEETKSKIKGKSNKLEFLITYALVKAQRYDKAIEQITNIDYIPTTHHQYFLELVNLLATNNRLDITLALVPKAEKLKLKQNFFISQSRTRSNIDEEMDLLEVGNTYLKTTGEANTKLENHLLKRYLEISNIYMGNHQSGNALKYLLKARELESLDASPYKADVLLNLGLAYKNLRKFSDAWANIKASAGLGNRRAKLIMTNLGKNYVP